MMAFPCPRETLITHMHTMCPLLVSCCAGLARRVQKAGTKCAHGAIAAVIGGFLPPSESLTRADTHERAQNASLLYLKRSQWGQQ